MKLFRHLTANEEKIENFPFKRELSMESYLVENEAVLSLDHDVFSDVAIVQEELTLKQGRSSNGTDGRIDILVTYSNEIIGVVELKLGELNEGHLVQLEDYLDGKDQIIQQFPDIINKDITPRPRWVGVLVGSGITSELKSKIQAGYTTLNGIPIAALIIQRYRSLTGCVYVTTDVIFRNILNSKDSSKFEFDGLSYGKGRLVLAVVKKYVEEHVDVTYSELERIFYKKLQGSIGVFATEEAARLNYDTTSRSRYFLKPDELVKISDCTIAISNQWGVGNIGGFVDKVRELGYRVNGT